MNLLLLHHSDFCEEKLVRIQGRRREHMLSVHRIELGSTLRVGTINGLMGQGTVLSIDHSSISLQVTIDTPPPTALPLSLVLALPRPKMLKRIFQTIACMGVKELILMNSYRVEKSYWQTPFLHPEKIEEQLILGLEQGVDTVIPKVSLEKSFKPFVEDRLPQLCQGKRALVAHPKNAVSCPAASLDDTVLVIGPEGGFIDYEIDKLNEAGCTTMHLGPRILRVETAVPALLSRLFPV